MKITANDHKKTHLKIIEMCFYLFIIIYNFNNYNYATLIGYSSKQTFQIRNAQAAP